MKNFNQKSIDSRKKKPAPAKFLALPGRRRQEARATKIQVVWETPAVELLKNAKGEVVGVKAMHNGKPVFYRGKKAVVLCSGGYEYSKPMRQAFLEGPALTAGLSTVRHPTPATVSPWVWPQAPVCRKQANPLPRGRSDSGSLQRHASWLHYSGCGFCQLHRG